MIRVHWKIDSKMRSSQRSIPSFKWPDWPPLSCCVILQMSRGSHLVPPTVGKLLSRSMGGTLFVYLFYISYSFGETQSNGHHCSVCHHRLCSLLPDNAPPPPASLPHPQGLLFCSITCIIPSPTPKVCSSPQDPLSSFRPLLGIRVFWSDPSCNGYWISFSFMQVAVTLSWVLLFTILRYQSVGE